MRRSTRVTTSRTSILLTRTTRLGPLVVAAGLAACGSSGTASQETTPTVVASAVMTAPTAVATTVAGLAEPVEMPDVLAFEAWSDMATSAVEWGDVFADLDSMIDNISVAAIGRIGTPVEKVWEDTETEDSFVYLEVPVTVVKTLAGRRSVQAGDSLTVVWIGPFSEELVGETGLWFLMNARDGASVDQYPNERDAYRLSPVALWFDRGDGVLIAPISELERRPEGIDLKVFVFDELNVPDATFHNVERQARAMSVEEFIAYVSARSGS